MLASIVQSAGDAIVTADSEGWILSWNPAAERTFGYPAEEAIGRQLTLIVPERFHDAHHAGMRRVVQTGRTKIIGHTVEVAAVRKDGTEIPVELSLSTWLSDGERYFAGILRDISERARLVGALTASEARMEAILQSANDAIVTIDAEGLVRLWNPMAEEMFGHASREMIGRPLTEIIPERFRSLHHAGVHRVASGGETHVIGGTVELAALHASGREFPIELSLAMWEHGGERFFSGIIRDISRRKESEAELQATADELRQKTDMLEALSSKLAKYLSRQVYDSIFEGRTEVRVESYRKKLTVFFSDIQGFTELTDIMEAEEVSSLLNTYLSEMARIAEEHGGTVDKFIGDGIMIFFGDPETRGEREDALACVRMAIDMRGRVDELRAGWTTRAGSAGLHVRMGINTGFCTVGNFGSEDRMDYTIVGKEVNAASRLEVAADAGQIRISNTTYELVKDEIETRPVGELRVKGLAYPIRTYEVVGAREEPSDQGFRLDFDPTKLAPEHAAAAREALRRALDAIETAPEDS
jgi:PAS domain S-box-containing protein